VNHNGMAAHLTRSDSEGYVQCIGWHWWWYDLEWLGKLGASVREMKVLTALMETVTLIGKYLSRFVY